MSLVGADSLLSLQETLSAVKAKVCIGKNSSETFSFTSVTTDSRSVKEGSLFVPLIGENQDGHKYVLQAAEKGASVIFAVEPSWNALPAADKNAVEEKCAVIFVENTMYALQAAAAAYVRKFPDLIRVGITGSNGKTTTKEIAVSVLSKHFNVIATQGNFNSETGLPLSVFNIRKEHQIGVFEMGMNRRGEITELANVLFPEFAIITNIGTAHIGILGSKHAIAEEKKQIFSNFSSKSVGFVPEKDEFASFLQDVKAGSVKLFGRVSQAASVTDVESAGLDGTSFRYYGRQVTFPLPGTYNFNNMLAVVSLAETLGLSKDEIIAGVESVKPLFGRSNINRGMFTVVEDCYNANAESMMEAVSFYGSVGVKGKKVFVLADMLELGDESERIHAETGARAARSGADKLVFVGPQMQAGAVAAEKAGTGVSVVSEKDVSDAAIAALAEKIASEAAAGDLFLVKGSRGMRLERITEVLNKAASR